MTTRPNPYGTRGYDRLYNHVDQYETKWIVQIRPYDTVLLNDVVLVVRCVRWSNGDVALDFTDGTSMPPAPIATKIKKLVYAK